MMNTMKNLHLVSNWSLLFLLGAILSLAGCSKECKSTADCGSGLVCKNGECTEPDFLPGPDSEDDSESAGDSDTDTDTDTDADSDSEPDTETETGDTETETEDTDTIVAECIENWECNDDSMCTTDVCDMGTCIYSATTPVPAGCCDGDEDCGDGDSCTSDSCNLTNWSCENTFVPSDVCCLESTHCDDGNSCTTDVCAADQRCQHVVDDISGACCEDEFDCASSSSCGYVSCVDYQCEYSVPDTDSLPAGCCNTEADCADDGNACTRTVCNAQKECDHVADATLGAACCAVDLDCDDGNSCTEDTCTSNKTCAFNPAPGPPLGCCATEGDCDDGDNCTADACISFTCDYESPTVLPVGCCADASDCDDGHACTREACDNGHCLSAPDATLGPECCESATDCGDGNQCSADACDGWNNECYYTAPNPVGMPAECCIVAGDCAHPTEPLCNISTCGVVDDYTCGYTPVDDSGTGSTCETGDYCDGEQSCVAGVCVTEPGTIPCGGETNPCRDRICDEATDDCALLFEYDTDVSCDDGIFCNGIDVCMAGDCAHISPPCEDSGPAFDCQDVTCDEAGMTCPVVNAPDNRSCAGSGEVCDGMNICLDGVCTAGSACGDGDDCNYYVCEEDTESGAPACTLMKASNGTACDVRYAGDCHGSANRECLDGICAMGTDPMCTPTSGLGADYQCFSAWGVPTGCIEDTLNFEYDIRDCAVETEPFVQFSTTLAHNTVDNYGATCGTGFTGGDFIFQVDLNSGEVLNIDVSEEQTTNGSNATVLILENANDPAGSCVSATPTSSTASYTANSTRSVWVVVDMQAGARAKGLITVSCL